MSRDPYLPDFFFWGGQPSKCCSCQMMTNILNTPECQHYYEDLLRPFLGKVIQYVNHFHRHCSKQNFFESMHQRSLVQKSHLGETLQNHLIPYRDHHSLIPHLYNPFWSFINKDPKAIHRIRLVHLLGHAGSF
jgi:hypothetical protein